MNKRVRLLQTRMLHDPALLFVSSHKNAQTLDKNCWQVQKENHLGGKEWREIWEGEGEARLTKSELCIVEWLHRVRRETWWEIINTSHQQQWKRESEDSKTKRNNWCQGQISFAALYHQSWMPQEQESRMESFSSACQTHEAGTPSQPSGGPGSSPCYSDTGSVCGSITDREPLDAQGQSHCNCILHRMESCLPPNKPVCSWE